MSSLLFLLGPVLGLAAAGGLSESAAARRNARLESSRGTRSAAQPQGEEVRLAWAGRASTGWSAAAAPQLQAAPAGAARIEAAPSAAFIINGQFLTEAEARSLPNFAKFEGLAESLSGNRESGGYSAQDEAFIQKILEDDAREEKQKKPTKKPAKPAPKPAPAPRFDGSFSSPLKAGVISSPFGVNRGDHRHSGLDIAAPSGTPIYASAGGTVIFTGWNGGYGNLVIVKHDSSKTTYYAHCSAFKTNKGARVAEGQRIANVGSTGNSTGPHVHFEIRVNGSPTNPCQRLNRC